MCYIGPHSYWSAKGGIIIGDNVIIGPYSKLWTYNHDFRDSSYIPYGGNDILKKVIIGDHVWIGMNVTILPGTTIGHGAVISAGSVLHGYIEPLSIVAGNLATIIGYRDKSNYEKCIKSKKLYLHGKLHK